MMLREKIDRFIFGVVFVQATTEGRSREKSFALEFDSVQSLIANEFEFYNFL